MNTVQMYTGKGSHAKPLSKRPESTVLGSPNPHKSSRLKKGHTIRKKGHSSTCPLSRLQTGLLKLVDELAIQDPGSNPAALIGERLNFWLSTPADQLAATVDSNGIRSAQYLLGLLTDIHSEGRKEVRHV